MSELCHVRASVMMYDAKQKRWYPCAGNGISRIIVMMERGQFRIVGRKLDSAEVSLNCQVKRSLIYNEATPTFHQWRFEGNVYGLV